MSVPADALAPNGPADAGAEAAPGGLRDVLRGVVRDRNGRIGLVITGVLVVTAVAATFGLTPHNPLAQHPDHLLESPSGTYWFGTDQFGRDIASRTFTGNSRSFSAGIVPAT